MMTRTFLPVGQGAFYAERFHLDSGRVNVVYDCGSTTGVHIAEACVRRHFQPGEEVAGVFLSHFDADHTNALPFLLQYCHVKNLFFPLLAEESREYLLLGELAAPSSAGSFFARFLRDPYGALNSLNLGYCPALRAVREPDSETRPWSVDATPIPSGDNVSDLLFTASQQAKADWLYIPFNFREDDRLKALKAAMRDRLGRVLSPGELQDQLEDGALTPEDIQALYKAVPGSLNTNSMTLLSGSPNPRIRQSPPRFPTQDPLSPGGASPSFAATSPNGCLYTGDYDALGPQKRGALRRAYQAYDGCIGCVQIPHHGSRHNYHHELLELGSCRFYPISAGSRSRYRHPHAAVLKDILESRRYPLLVTERSGGVWFDIQ